MRVRAKTKKHREKVLAGEGGMKALPRLDENQSVIA
jgi:hypothetical protein